MTNEYYLTHGTIDKKSVFVYYQLELVLMAGGGHRRQAAVVAEARCARRDATHNDAFEHLVWLHSCSGSLGVMNARRLSHLKHAGASAALEIARQDVLADAQQHISLSTLDMARCVSDFSDVNNVDMKVCGSCGTRDPDDPYSREVTEAHMVNTMNFRFRTEYRHPF